MGMIEMRGRWYRWSKKDTTDDYLSLDITTFAKSVDLDRWLMGSWRWTWSNGRESSISYIVEPGRRGVRLQYTSSGQEYDYLVPVVKTQPNYGGVRYWWLCPSCGRRVRILYGGSIFACRRCHNLTYETTQKGGDLMTTIDNRLRRIRHKLGATGGGILDAFPQRPKGMQLRTYERLMREYYNLHKMRDLAFTSEAASLLGIFKSDDSLSLPPKAIAAYTKQEWQAHKADPARIPHQWRAMARRWPAEPERPQSSRLTLGELAALADVPYAFAVEAQRKGLIQPDQGRTTRRKRYRERLKHWLKKLWTLRSEGMSWEDIQAWSKRRFQPEHGHEKVWPVGYRGNAE
jgi:hypothetical protein